MIAVILSLLSVLIVLIGLRNLVEPGDRNSVKVERELTASFRYIRSVGQ
jgi:hypothetical protein